MVTSLKPAVQLKRGDVLALPFDKTARIENDPRVGRRFVTFRTEYGLTRLGRDSEVLVAG